MIIIVKHRSTHQISVLSLSNSIWQVQPRSFRGTLVDVRKAGTILYCDGLASWQERWFFVLLQEVGFDYPASVNQRWRSCLRHWATIRKVACSIPSDAIYIFNWFNPSCRTMALEPTETPAEISTRNILWGKDGQCLGLTTLPPVCADCLEILRPSISRRSVGLSRPVILSWII